MRSTALADLLPLQMRYSGCGRNGHDTPIWVTSGLAQAAQHLLVLLHTLDGRLFFMPTKFVETLLVATELRSTMPRQPQRTIDQILSAEKHSEEDFAVQQRHLLLRLFTSAAFTSWKQRDPRDLAAPTAATRDLASEDTLRSKRPNNSSYKAQDQAPQAKYSAAANSRVIRTKRRLSRSSSDECGPATSAPAKRDASRLRSQEVPLPTPSEPHPSVPLPTQPTGTAPGTTATTQPRSRKTVELRAAEATAQSLLRSYRPIEDGTVFFKGLECKLKNRHEYQIWKAPDHTAHLFGVYVGARRDEDLSRGIQKITALIWMQLYPKRVITWKEYEHAHMQTGLGIPQLQHMVKQMRADGRARQQLVGCFGEGCVLLLDGIGAW